MGGLEGDGGRRGGGGLISIGIVPICKESLGGKEGGGRGRGRIWEGLVCPTPIFITLFTQRDIRRKKYFLDTLLFEQLSGRQDTSKGSVDI